MAQISNRCRNPCCSWNYCQKKYKPSLLTITSHSQAPSLSEDEDVGVECCGYCPVMHARSAYCTIDDGTGRKSSHRGEVYSTTAPDTKEKLYLQRLIRRKNSNKNTQGYHQTCYDDRNEYKNINSHSPTSDKTLRTCKSICPRHSKAPKKGIDINKLEESYWASWKPNKTVEQKGNTVESRVTIAPIVPALDNFVKCRSCLRYIGNDQNKKKCLRCQHKNLEVIESDWSEENQCNLNDTIIEGEEEEEEEEEDEEEETTFGAELDYSTTENSYSKNDTTTPCRDTEMTTETTQTTTVMSKSTGTIKKSNRSLKQDSRDASTKGKYNHPKRRGKIAETTNLKILNDTATMEKLKAYVLADATQTSDTTQFAPQLDTDTSLKSHTEINHSNESPLTTAPSYISDFSRADSTKSKKPHLQFARSNNSQQVSESSIRSNSKEAIINSPPTEDIPSINTQSTQYSVQIIEKPIQNIHQQHSPEKPSLGNVAFTTASNESENSSFDLDKAQVAMDAERKKTSMSHIEDVTDVVPQPSEKQIQVAPVQKSQQLQFPDNQGLDLLPNLEAQDVPEKLNSAPTSQKSSRVFQSERETNTNHDPLYEEMLIKEHIYSDTLEENVLVNNSASIANSFEDNVTHNSNQSSKTTSEPIAWDSSKSHQQVSLPNKVQIETIPVNEDSEVKLNTNQPMRQEQELITIKPVAPVRSSITSEKDFNSMHSRHSALFQPQKLGRVNLKGHSYPLKSLNSLATKKSVANSVRVKYK